MYENYSLKRDDIVLIIKLSSRLGKVTSDESKILSLQKKKKTNYFYVPFCMLIAQSKLIWPLQNGVRNPWCWFLS